MKTDPKEEAGAYRWIGTAGLAAVALCFFLVYADNSMSTSKREHILGVTLKELRTAQTTLPSRVSDQRQIQPVLHGSSAETQASY